MRRTTLCSVLLLALLAATPLASAARSRPKAAPKCPPRHSRLVTADAQAEVYIRPEGVGPHGGYQAEGIFGCAYRDGRAYELGPPPSGGSSSGSAGVDKETLTGPIVAYEAFSNGANGGYSSSHVLVRDLRNGRLLHRIPTGTSPTPTPRQVGIGSVVAIVVKSDGAVAWMLEVDNELGKYQVHAVDKSGSRVLASGPEVDPSSLTLADSTLYWTQGGKPYSASLD